MLTIAVQAGGASTRMGHNKALMPFLGEALIQRVIRRLLPIADELVITASQPGIYAITCQKTAADLLPGAGALGGLYTALAVSENEFTAVAACDLPFCSPEIFSMLAGRLLASGADAAVPVSEDGTYEVMHAVYRRDTCLPAVRIALESGKHKLISWFPQVKVDLVPPEIWQAAGGGKLAFINVNTPEEFARAEALARRLAEG